MGEDAVKAIALLMRSHVYAGLIFVAALTVTPYVADWHVLCEQLTSFQVQYLAGAVVLLALALCLRRWGAGVLAGALVVVLLVRVGLAPGAEAHAAPPASQASETAFSVKLVCANLLYDNRDASGLLAWVKEKGPDIICIQEYGDLAATDVERGLREAYPFSVVQPDNSPSGMATFSRYPLQAAPFRKEIADELQQMAPRIPQIQRFRMSKNDVEFMVYNVHPMAPGGKTALETRNAQLRLLAQAVASESLSVIVAGDLNITPWSPRYAEFMRDSRLKRARAGRLPMPTWPARGLPLARWLAPGPAKDLARIPLDYVLHGPGIECVTITRGPQVGSDHLPIYAELRVPRRAF